MFLIINSNTTLVTVHQIRTVQRSCHVRIQIQHLLLFICSIDKTKALVWLFKYNTCYCSSSGASGFVIPPITIQIQHLLLFIIKPHFKRIWSEAFKYNTCYCSSVAVVLFPMPPFIQIQHLLLFIVSPEELNPDYVSFKYNTCYCSSHVNKGFLRNIKAQKPYIYAIS